MTFTFDSGHQRYREPSIAVWNFRSRNGLKRSPPGSGAPWGGIPSLYASRMDFFNAYAQGFARVAAATLPVADFAPDTNAEQIGRAHV